MTIPTTGTGANQINVDGAGNASANLVKISGSAVSTSSAQLGVNAVNIAGQAATLDANNLLKVGVEAIDGNTSAPTNIKNAMASVAHGTCTTGASSTSIPTSAFTGPGVGAINQFVGRTMIFDSGTTTTALQGQATAITASTNSATPTFTVTALTTAPSSGDTFSIV